jgi:hypothetical protein
MFRSMLSISASIIVSSVCVVGIVMADTDYERLNYFADRIALKMPSTWNVVQKKTDVIPYGHYDGMQYEGPKGLSITLEGDRTVFFHWKGKDGNWHQEPLAKESLQIWIMPPEYKQSWKRFFIMKSPEPAEAVFSGGEVKVYGYPSHRLESQEAFEKKLSLLPAVTTGWPDSPQHTGVLSWDTWKEDIKKALQGSD